MNDQINDEKQRVINEYLRMSSFLLNQIETTISSLLLHDGVVDSVTYSTITLMYIYNHSISNFINKVKDDSFTDELTPYKTYKLTIEILKDVIKNLEANIDAEHAIRTGECNE